MVHKGKSIIMPLVDIFDYFASLLKWKRKLRGTLGASGKNSKGPTGGRKRSYL